MNKEAAISKLEDSLSKKNLLIHAINSGLFCGIFFGAEYFWQSGSWLKGVLMGIPFGVVMGLSAPSGKTRIVRLAIEQIRGNKVHFIDYFKPQPGWQIALARNVFDNRIGISISEIFFEVNFEGCQFS